MESVVASAIRASKYYKHVVQLVEKFIVSCPASHKLSGLLIVDAILRHSKGSNSADVYRYRFVRNINTLFLAISKSPPSDKPLIFRILKIWREEIVYPDNLIIVLQELVNNPSDADLQDAGTSFFMLYILNSPKSCFTNNDFLRIETFRVESRTIGKQGISPVDLSG